MKFVDSGHSPALVQAAFNPEPAGPSSASRPRGSSALCLTPRAAHLPWLSLAAQADNGHRTLVSELTCSDGATAVKEQRARHPARRSAGMRLHTHRPRPCRELAPRRARWARRGVTKSTRRCSPPRRRWQRPAPKHPEWLQVLPLKKYNVHRVQWAK